MLCLPIVSYVCHISLVYLACLHGCSTGYFSFNSCLSLSIPSLLLDFETPFLNSTNITDSEYRVWVEGSGGRWEAEGGLCHPWAQGQSHCAFSKTQKQPQCTCQAKTVAGSSLTPHAVLLVHSSGTRYPTVVVMNLQGQKNAACESRLGYL